MAASIIFAKTENKPDYSSAPLRQEALVRFAGAGNDAVSAHPKTLSADCYTRSMKNLKTGKVYSLPKEKQNHILYTFPLNNMASFQTYSYKTQAAASYAFRRIGGLQVNKTGNQYVCGSTLNTGAGDMKGICIILDKNKGFGQVNERYDSRRYYSECSFTVK